MKTIVILTRRPEAAADVFARFHRDELLAVWAGIATGVVRTIHGLQEGAGVVLEMETSASHEARRFVASLPYVEQGLLDVRYFPVKPFTAFEALFATAAAPGSS